MYGNGDGADSDSRMSDAMRRVGIQDRGLMTGRNSESASYADSVEIARDAVSGRPTHSRKV